MPIYEYLCSECDLKFDLMRPVSEASQPASCPRCQNTAPRTISVFSHYAASAPGSPQRTAEKQRDKAWQATRKFEDKIKKNPDQLKPWREERQKALGVGPEKWTEWAKEEKAKEQKKKDYGEGWLGREA